MATTPFDSFAYAHKLEQAGISREQAEALAHEMLELVNSQAAAMKKLEDQQAVLQAALEKAQIENHKLWKDADKFWRKEFEQYTQFIDARIKQQKDLSEIELSIFKWKLAAVAVLCFLVFKVFGIF